MSTGKYKYTCNWFDIHIPAWEEHLLPWRKCLGDLIAFRALEIGAYEGKSTVWIVENMIAPYPSSMLEVVDAWPGPEYQPMKERFLYNVMATECHDRVRIHSKPSAQVLHSLTSKSYDFIYVDGSHKLADVKHDTMQALRLIRSGGLILWDDYCCATTPKEEMDEVRAGVDAGINQWVDEGGAPPMTCTVGHHLAYWKEPSQE